MIKKKVHKIITENEDLKEIKKSSLKDLLTGDFIGKKFIRKQFLLLLFSIGLIFTYMNNRMTCEQQVRKISELNKELINEKYICMVTEAELLARIEELNNDDDVDGFIVQLPLPKHISEQKIIEAIDYRKDVDGFHPINVGRTSIGLPAFVSATPAGILELLKRYEIETAGKHVVVLGRSNIVGKPVAQLLMQKAYTGNATVTVCHSYSKDLKEQCLKADIIIAALGSPNFVTADMVKEGAVIIDVGTTRVPNANTKSGFKLTGDVKFDEVAPKYVDRNGGYTRIVKIGQRKGDGALEVVLELV